MRLHDISSLQCIQREMERQAALSVTIAFLEGMRKQDEIRKADEVLASFYEERGREMQEGKVA